MSRPASIRSSSSPFVRQKRKAGSQKLGLDMEKIDISYNHREADRENNLNLTYLRLELIAAERDGRYSKAKKLRRTINQALEQGLYLTHSWCQGCNNVLHNCNC
jgi:hypothetical protein